MHKAAGQFWSARQRYTNIFFSERCRLQKLSAGVYILSLCWQECNYWVATALLVSSLTLTLWIPGNSLDPPACTPSSFKMLPVYNWGADLTPFWFIGGDAKWPPSYSRFLMEAKAKNSGHPLYFPYQWGGGELCGPPSICLILQLRFGVGGDVQWEATLFCSPFH